MAVTSDIVESWRSPRVVVRRLMDRGGSESFLLSFLLTFLLLALVASAPNQARLALADPDMCLMQRLYGVALGLLAAIPLMYLLAAVGHLVARALGGQGSFHGARLALFWAALVASPAMLVHGLAVGLRGTGGAVTGLGLLVAALFLGLWLIMLHEVES